MYAIRQHRRGKRAFAVAGQMQHPANMLTESSLRSLPTGLRLDNNGTIRVRRSRVTFDLVIGQFEEGAWAEDIVARFTTLDLPSVCSSIAKRSKAGGLPTACANALEPLI